MSKKKRRGGPRANAGRKPVSDKKVALYLYVPESIINGYGGADNARKAAENFLIIHAIKPQ